MKARTTDQTCAPKRIFSRRFARLTLIAAWMLSIPAFSQFITTTIQPVVDPRLAQGGGGPVKLDAVKPGVVVGSQADPLTGAPQGVVYDIATQKLIKVLAPYTEILATDGTATAGIELFGGTITRCLSDTTFTMPVPPASYTSLWTWCAGTDQGLVVGTQHIKFVLSPTSDPPSAGLTAESQRGFVNETFLESPDCGNDVCDTRALAVSGNEQVGDAHGPTDGPGSFNTNSSAMLWHGDTPSFVQLGLPCDATMIRTHGGCDYSSALATNGSQEGGFLGFGGGPAHATMWSGTAASQVDLHPAGFATSRVTGMSTVFQTGDGFTASVPGGAPATHHGLLWQGTAASVVDLNQFLPAAYPWVTVSGTDADGDIAGTMQPVDSSGAPLPNSVGFVLTPIPSLSVSSFTLTPSNAAPGDTVTATVTLRAPAASGGVWVNIATSDNDVVPVPASVFVPEGQLSGSVNVSLPATAFLTAPETVTLMASANYTGRAATLTVTPKTPADAIISVTLPSNRQHPGAIVAGQVALTAPAPAGGAIVSFKIQGMTVTPGPYDSFCGCNGPSVTTFYALTPGEVSTPPSLIVPAGQTTAAFSLSVGSNLYRVEQVAVQAATGNVMKQAVLNIGPPAVFSALSFLNSEALPTTAPYPGGTSQNLAQVSTSVATETPLIVTFTSTNPAIVMPPSVTITGGTIGQAFYFSTLPVPVLTTGIVTATTNGVSVSASVSVAPSPQPVLTSVSIPFVSSGQTFTGTVTLSAAPLLGGATVALTSDTPGVAAVPASIVIPFGAGVRTATFTGIAGPVAGPVSVTITASFNGISVPGTLQVIPGPVLSLPSYTLSPYTMVGPGVVTTGTVTLNQPAPLGGVTVALSTNSSAVKIPASVVFAQGQTSASFSVQGNGVSTTTQASLTATYQGPLAPGQAVSASTSITVAPTDSLKAAVKPTWSTSTHVLTATVTSTNPLATVTALNANGNVPLGTMTNLGNGNYSFQTTIANISSVNFKSNLGGATGQGVTVIP